MENAPGITLGDDGIYRWSHKRNLYTDFTILLLVLKVMLISILITWLLAFLICCWTRDFWFDGLIGISKGFGVAFAILMALTIPSYYIYAFVMGGSYNVNFEMNEKGVKHEQDAKQQKRAKIIASLAVFSGSRAKSIGAMSAGRNAACHTMLYSDFSKVKYIVPNKEKQLIEVNGRLVHNQIYAADEDFDWVLEFIKKHCPKAK